MEIAFSAMPHEESAKEILPLLNCGIKVIDMSADFRLKDSGEYQRWYGFTHPAPQWLSKAVYGIPELHRDQISEAQLIANPGCYPTSYSSSGPGSNSWNNQPDIVIDSNRVSGAAEA
jgi:N-acetyl-gamma-glutamyl-phosphate reductase